MEYAAAVVSIALAPFVAFPVLAGCYRTVRNWPQRVRVWRDDRRYAKRRRIIDEHLRAGRREPALVCEQAWFPAEAERRWTRIWPRD